MKLLRRSVIVSIILAVLMLVQAAAVFAGDPADESAECVKHSWNKWTVLKPASCNEEGVRSRTCTVCGKTESLPISKTEHFWADWEITREPTCTKAGSRTRVCDTCGEVETEKIARLGHSYGKWVTTRKATYLAKGSHYRICKVCGRKQTKAIARKTAYNKWVKVDGKRYYMNSKSKQVKGWKLLPASNKENADVRWCLFDTKGVFKGSISKDTASKWVKIGKKEYYFTDKMRPIGEGFHLINNKLYCMDKNKALIYGTIIVDDETFQTGKGGRIEGLPYYKYKYGTFVYVNKTQQRLWYYKDGEKQFDADVITGTKGRHDTPSGTYTLIYRGRNMNLSWAGKIWPVKYWISFQGNLLGFHDASWRDNAEFSDHSRYLTDGSHGCVNMRARDAAKLYKQAPDGTRVIIED